MKWLLISKRSGHEMYELWDSEGKLVTLSFHPGSGSLRITADDEKRVFLVGREGVLRPRTVLRNEYGVRITLLVYENGNDNIGTIDFDNEKFTYSIQNHVAPDLTIYRNGESLVTCELPSAQKEEPYENYDFLVLTLCWYLFSIVKRHAEEFA